MPFSQKIFLTLLNYNVSRLQNLLNLAKAKIAWIIQSYAYTYICLPITTTSHSAEWDFHMRKDFRIKLSQNTSRNVTSVPLKSMWIQRPMSGWCLVSSVFNPSLCLLQLFSLPFSWHLLFWFWLGMKGIKILYSVLVHRESKDKKISGSFIIFLF